jgi:hypothetical protein
MNLFMNLIFCYLVRTLPKNPIIKEFLKVLAFLLSKILLIPFNKN